MEFMIKTDKYRHLISSYIFIGLTISLCFLVKFNFTHDVPHLSPVLNGLLFSIICIGFFSSIISIILHFILENKSQYLVYLIVLYIIYIHLLIFTFILLFFASFYTVWGFGFPDITI